MFTLADATTILYKIKVMQNLFERLKPEAKVVIDEQADRYPLSVASITDELKSNSFLGDIKYDYVMWLARDSKGQGNETHNYSIS